MTVFEQTSKDPQAVRSFYFDWTDSFPEDPITSSSWTITGDDEALVKDSEESVSYQTKITLSGGTLGVLYRITNHVITESGEEDDWSVLVLIENS